MARRHDSSAFARRYAERHCHEVDDSAVLALSHVAHSFVEGVCQLSADREVIGKSDVARALCALGCPPAEAQSTARASPPAPAPERTTALLREAFCEPADV